MRGLVSPIRVSRVSTPSASLGPRRPPIIASTGRAQFGGLRINPSAQVLDTDMQPITGVFAAGELVGGIFYFNYPGGSGLTNGSVFGRLAGYGAAAA
jgi:succinate dehydrogenase/fumarate reductase flavoprotein subunit